MDLCRPNPQYDDFARGRKRTPKCLFRDRRPVIKTTIGSGRGHIEVHVLGVKSLDDILEEEEDSLMSCSCKRSVKLDAKPIIVPNVSTESPAYPPYLRLIAREAILVKGTTCRFVMRALEDNVTLLGITTLLAKQLPSERYTSHELRSIVQTCLRYGLHGESPYATASWENEPIEGWWIKENSYCETLRREQPIGEDVCGYKCDGGWWKGRQSGSNRAWSIWGYRSVGPRVRRKEQLRVYDLHGSSALVLGTLDD
jgi:hypothetical protein